MTDYDRWACVGAGCGGAVLIVEGSAPPRPDRWVRVARGHAVCSVVPPAPAETAGSTGYVCPDCLLTYRLVGEPATREP